MIKQSDKKIMQFESFMEELLKEEKLIGASVAFVYHNEIFYSNGFGYANLTTKQKMTADTIMSIQSVSKSFAAVSIMQLVEKGLIELDRPLVDYLPYFQTTDKALSDKITVRQLLSHTAGFPHEIGIANLVTPNKNELPNFKEWQEKLGISDETLASIQSFEDITKYFKNVTLDYSPGESWMYCTDAYAIVGDLFEKVSGLSWYDHMQENVFEKIGMTRTTLKPDIAENDQDSSRYYIKNDEGMLETPFPMNRIAAPAGFIYSTANDMATYLAANMDEDGLVLKKYSLKEMQKPYPNVEIPSPPNAEVKDIGYGLGWGQIKYKGLDIISHGGGYPGIRAWVAMIPEQKFGVVVLTNVDHANPQEIALKGIDLIL
ncbi:hypothetical protein CIB95_08990 [Lottiidibacillus patelloidae]|uniref:Beta-lactamase-related domain-containing protein n=1 Tax=Lottiidibacillus patelloidae TaxID=2670334 RepID=A0A263BT68_9BACI|nr:serine hydrolase domain-containing protein [Lottiidibacillus patelloidae]OZM56895.1 hypothetical protein CIB95_08990 [Lottiidibacillus patelloidae]